MIARTKILALACSWSGLALLVCSWIALSTILYAAPDKSYFFISQFTVAVAAVLYSFTLRADTKSVRSPSFSSGIEQPGFLWKAINREYPYFALSACSIFQLALVVATFCSIIGTVLATQLIGATLAVNLGHLQSGERIFKSVYLPFNWKEDMSLLTLMDSPNGQLTPSDIATADRVVANVYGSSSRQMAYRYWALGERMLQRKEASTAQVYLEKSIVQYQTLNSPDEAALAKSSLVDCLVQQGDKLAAERVLEETTKLIENSPAVLRGNYIWNSLARAAEKIGNVSQAEALHARDNIMFKSMTADLIVKESAVLLPIILVWCGTIFGLDRIQFLLAQKWKQRLACTQDLNTCIDTLDKLTTLELQRENFAQADNYSKQLLCIAEKGEPLPVRHLHLVAKDAV